VIAPLIDTKAGEKVEAHIADGWRRAPRSWPAASAAKGPTYFYSRDIGR